MVTFRAGWVPTPPERPRVRLDAALRTAVTLPPSVNYSGIPSIGMLLNDTWGDCVLAGDGHIIEGVTYFGQGTEYVVTDPEALAAYEAVGGFDPNAGPPGANPTDNGAMISDGLAYLKNTGMGGHKIAGYGALSDLSGHQNVQLCVYEFGFLSIGVNLPQSAEDQFNAGQPWTVSGDGTIIGGHCVICCGYNATGPVLWTWGGVQQADWAWWDAYVSEAWPVISADWVSAASGKDPEGVDLATLGAEFQSVTGENPFPSPVPVPPSPVPAPPVPVPPAPSPAPGCSPFGKVANALLRWRHCSD